MAEKQSKKSAQSKKRVNTQKSYTPGSKGLSTPAKVLIVFFAVLMALSLMIPSISAIFSDNSSSDQTITIDDLRKSIDTQYTATIDTLLQQLDADPENPDLLKQIGDAYIGWATYSSYYAMTDEQTLETYDHAKKAKEYYDKYLENNDDADVADSAAMCIYYYGETSNAIKALEEVCEKYPDHAGSYANLGMLYEVQGETDKAIENYNLAIEKDPEDADGAKSYAESRLSALTETDETTDDTATTDTTDTTSTTDTTAATDTTDSSSTTDTTDTTDDAASDSDSSSN